MVELEQQDSNEIIRDAMTYSLFATVWRTLHGNRVYSQSTDLNFHKFIQQTSEDVWQINDGANALFANDNLPKNYLFGSCEKLSARAIAYLGMHHSDHFQFLGLLKSSWTAEESTTPMTYNWRYHVIPICQDIDGNGHSFSLNKLRTDQNLPIYTAKSLTKIMPSVQKTEGEYWPTVDFIEQAILDAKSEGKNQLFASREGVSCVQIERTKSGVFEFGEIDITKFVAEISL